MKRILTLGLMLLLATSAIVVNAPQAMAADTAATKPTANSSSGTTHPEYAYDSSLTTFATFGSNDNATYTTFNISIPPGATIDTVKVTLYGNTTERQATVAVSSDGTNFSSAQTTAFTSTNASYNFTGASSKWGLLTWTPASFNNNLFKVKIVQAFCWSGTLFL